MNLYNYVNNSPTCVADLLGEKGFFGVVGTVLGDIWNVPNTAIGVLWGGLGIPFGAKPTFGNGALQFVNDPLMFGGDITIGNVICYRPGMGPTDPLYPGCPYTFSSHECQHVTQGQQLGPLFFPVYGISGLTSVLQGGNFFGPGNVMEYGPYLPETYPGGQISPVYLPGYVTFGLNTLLSGGNPFNPGNLTGPVLIFPGITLPPVPPRPWP